MIDKKYEFQVKDSSSTYNVYRHKGRYVLDYVDGRPSDVYYPINTDKGNWINLTQRYSIKVEKTAKLTLPILYRNIHFQEDLRLLVRGSEGKVSVFEEGMFSADEWTDEEAISNILSGVWRVQSVGNVSFGGE